MTISDVYLKHLLDRIEALEKLVLDFIVMGDSTPVYISPKGTSYSDIEPTPIPRDAAGNIDRESLERELWKKLRKEI